MAVKKRVHHRRKAAPVVHHRAPVTHRKTTRRRRTYSRKPKTLLSEAFNPAAMKSTGSALISGGLGFFSLYMLNKQMQNAPQIQRILLNSGVALITGAWLGMPNLAAGMAGAAVLDMVNTANNAKMTEGADYLNAAQLKQLPAVLSESYLAESYLNAGYLNEGDYTDFEEMED